LFRMELGLVVLGAFLVSILVSISATTPPPEDYQLEEYAWIKEDGAAAGSWRQYNNTGWNQLNLTYAFSKCNIAYVTRSTSASDHFNVTFIVYRNESSTNGFDEEGYLFPGSKPNWSVTTPAQYTHTSGGYVYHLFIVSFDPKAVPGIYQVRINETGPGAGSDWNTPDGNPNVQWMFFKVPGANLLVNITDQLGRHPPFYLDGGSLTTKLNVTLTVSPPGNRTGSSTALIEWLDTDRTPLMRRTIPVRYVTGVGWTAGEIIDVNSTTFPYNATHPYRVQSTLGCFSGATSFKVLSTSWATASLNVTPLNGQWFDPSNFKASFEVVINTGLPGNPYQDVHNLTIQLWNSSGFVGIVANLSWNITPYPVIPGSSYTYSWDGMIPAGYIDPHPDDCLEFFGAYRLKSVPPPGQFQSLSRELSFYVDDPLECYTSSEMASRSARSAFKSGEQIWLNIELDPRYLRNRHHVNKAYADKTVTVTWDWPNPPPDHVKEETLAARVNLSWPSRQPWAFSFVNSSGFPDGTYVIRMRARCDSGYVVWETKTYDIYQFYEPPTEPDPRWPYTSIRVSPSSNATWRSKSTTIDLYAADISPGSGVEKVFYQIDNQPPISSPPFHVHVTFSALEGEHIYTYWSKDRAGNQEIPKSILLRVDTQPPTTHISPASSDDLYEPPVTIHLFATDPEPSSGIFKTFYRIDSSSAAEYPIDGFQALEGDHNYTFWSVDLAGNTGAESWARIRVGVPEGLTAALMLLIVGGFLGRARLVVGQPKG